MPTPAPLPVAALQTDIAWEDPSVNFPRAAALARQARAAGARLVALPEMFATGFTMNAAGAAAHAEDTRRFLAELARELDLWIIGGYVESGLERPRNTCALFDPAGDERLRYHKLHPFAYAGEDRHYAAGEALATANLEGLRVTPLICYDLRFPEPFRAAARHTDLFVVIANWPQARREHWTTLLKARAIENQCYVLGVNRVGEGDGLVYTGDSALFDPLGELLASASRRPGVISGAVDPSSVATLRHRFPSLADRRPDLYASLESSPPTP